MQSSETEELRLVNSHLRSAICKAVNQGRNIIRTNSADPEDWRADMQMLVNDLEGIFEGQRTMSPTAPENMAQEAYAIRQEISRHCLRGEPYRGFTAIWCGDENNRSLQFKDANGNEIEIQGEDSDDWRFDAWLKAKSAIDAQVEHNVDRPRG
jgi:hypothetical protein